MKEEKVTLIKIWFTEFLGTSERWYISFKSVHLAFLHLLSQESQ